MLNKSCKYKGKSPLSVYVLNITWPLISFDESKDRPSGAYLGGCLHS